MALITLDQGDLEIQIKFITKNNFDQLISDGSHADTTYSWGERGFHEWKTQTNYNMDAMAVLEGTTGVRAQGTLSMAVLPIEGDTATIGSVVYTFVGPDGTIRSQGTLTLDSQVVEDEVMIIGDVAYIFMDTGNYDAEAGGAFLQQIEIGADVAGTQANILARVNREDALYNTKVTMSDFADDVSTLTARSGGASGDLIGTTEDFSEVTNVFDDDTLGTTKAGADAVADSATAASVIMLGDDRIEDVQATLVALINGVGFTLFNADVSAGTFATDESIITARATGTAGNALASTETFTDAGNIFDDDTLGTTTLGVVEVPNATIVAGTTHLSVVDCWRDCRAKLNAFFVAANGVINP